MSQYLFDGLPPKVVTYIKIHLRYIFSTGLFNSQEREDLIQDLVLFYLERFHRSNNVPDEYIFTAIKNNANLIIRTRLQDMQAGFLNMGSLNDMYDEEGFEPPSNFSLEDLENSIVLKEIKKCLSDKQCQFIDLLLEGYSAEEARAQLHITHKVFNSIRNRIIKEQKKNLK